MMTGELLADLSLLLGAATRVGAAIAMFLFLNYMLAKGRLLWSPDSQDAAVFFIALVVGLGRAGRRASTLILPGAGHHAFLVGGRFDGKPFCGSNCSTAAER